MKKNYRPKKTITSGKRRRRKKEGTAAQNLGKLCSYVLIVFFLSFLYIQAPKFISKLYQITADVGLVVKDVIIEGQKNTNSEKISRAIKIKSGTPIFEVSLWELKKRLESIEWIKSVSISRELPNNIHIFIEERKPIALGQKDKQLYLIDDEGAIIYEKNLKNYLHLPIIIGDGAEIYASSLIEMLKVEPELFKHISSIARVSERRWNIRLNEKIEVKMPEDNFDNAWKLVIKLFKKNELFNQDIKVIDLRIKNKIFIEKW